MEFSFRLKFWDRSEKLPAIMPHSSPPGADGQQARPPFNGYSTAELASVVREPASPEITQAAALRIVAQAEAYAEKPTGSGEDVRLIDACVAVAVHAGGELGARAATAWAQLVALDPSAEFRVTAATQALEKIGLRKVIRREAGQADPSAEGQLFPMKYSYLVNPVDPKKKDLVDFSTAVGNVFLEHVSKVAPDPSGYSEKLHKATLLLSQILPQFEVGKKAAASLAEYEIARSVCEAIRGGREDAEKSVETWVRLVEGSPSPVTQVSAALKAVKAISYYGCQSDNARAILLERFLTNAERVFVAQLENLPLDTFGYSADQHDACLTMRSLSTSKPVQGKVRKVLARINLARSAHEAWIEASRATQQVEKGLKAITAIMDKYADRKELMRLGDGVQPIARDEAREDVGKISALCVDVLATASTGKVDSFRTNQVLIAMPSIARWAKGLGDRDVSEGYTLALDLIVRYANAFDAPAGTGNPLDAVGSLHVANGLKAFRMVALEVGERYPELLIDFRYRFVSSEPHTRLIGANGPSGQVNRLIASQLHEVTSSAIGDSGSLVLEHAPSLGPAAELPALHAPSDPPSPRPEVGSCMA